MVELLGAVQNHTRNCNIDS